MAACNLAAYIPSRGFLPQRTVRFLKCSQRKLQTLSLVALLSKDGALLLGLQFSGWLRNWLTILTLKVHFDYHAQYWFSFKPVAQPYCIREEAIGDNCVIGSNGTRVHSITKDKRASVALSWDLPTNFAGSLGSVIYTIPVAVHGSFLDEKVRLLYMNQRNRAPMYFNHHKKASVRLLGKEAKSRGSENRLRRLEHDTPTRWRFRLGARLNHLMQIYNIAEVTEELRVSNTDHSPFRRIRETPRPK